MDPRKMNPNDFSPLHGEICMSSFHHSNAELMDVKELKVNDRHPYLGPVVDNTYRDLTQSETWQSSPLKNGAIKSCESAKENSTLIPLASSNQGLLNFKGIVFLSFWYFFSFATLFLNKYILSYKNGDPVVLGSIQLLLCSVGGYFQMQYPCNNFRIQGNKDKSPRFIQKMLLVGTLRFLTLLLGLVALWYVPVSFAETVKSSAPVFTVVISRILMAEKTTWLVNLSLIPVMGGLALCSAKELSFNMAGFIAAVATNLSECFQNVYSKMLLSGDSFSPPELQFYTSTASICVQIPVLIMMVNLPSFWATFDATMVTLLILNGISFHFQSISEYTLLCCISPVTHSVANTVKRALLILLSVLTFGNPITFLSGLGTATVIIGVFFYNKAQQRTPVLSVPAQIIKRVHTI